SHRHRIAGHVGGFQIDVDEWREDAAGISMIVNARDNAAPRRKVRPARVTGNRGKANRHPLSQILEVHRLAKARAYDPVSAESLGHPAQRSRFGRKAQRDCVPEGSVAECRKSSEGIESRLA